MANCAFRTKLPHLFKTSDEVFPHSTMTGISQQFCVRWNSHLGSLGAAFPQLLAGQQFLDVTLACDGHQVHCHRLVLAACSSYFESLLSENPCKHPIIILPKDIKLWEIHALVDFMYKGQVNVSQAGLPQLLKCAETLQIRGLCGTDSTLNEVANSKNCDVLGATNLLPNNCSPNFNFTSMFASNLLNQNYQTDVDHQLGQQQQQQQQQQHIADIQRVAVATVTTDNAKLTNHRSNELNLVKKQKPHKHSANNDSSTKENHSIGSTNKHVKRANENGGNELNIKCEEIDESDVNVGNGDDDDDELSISKQAEYAMANVVCEYANESPRPTSAAADSIHLDDSGLNTDYRSMSPPTKRFGGDSYYGSMSEPGRRIRRSESLLRQAADNVSRGQTFQTVSDMFQIPISTIRFFMARKGILPRRKRGRASTATADIDDTSMHSNRPTAKVEADSCTSNKLNNSEQTITRPDEH